MLIGDNDTAKIHINVASITTTATTSSSANGCTKTESRIFLFGIFRLPISCTRFRFGDAAAASATTTTNGLSNKATRIGTRRGDVGEGIDYNIAGIATSPPLGTHGKGNTDSSTLTFRRCPTASTSTAANGLSQKAFGVIPTGNNGDIERI